MSDKAKIMITICIYRITIILSVLTFANYNGTGYLWLLLLLLTTFTSSDKEEVENGKDSIPNN